MGTEWRILADSMLSAADSDALQADFQAAVDEVDSQMSTWSPDSALMRFNAAPVGPWLPLPAALLTVLEAGLAVSQASEGAFEMNVGDAVRAWGFGPAPIDLSAIQAARAARRIRAAQALELDPAAGMARKTAPLALDLSGIAKGYGVDRLAEVAQAHGVAHALCSIDGELRAIGTRADGQAWQVGIDAPDGAVRGAHSRLTLADLAVATSGDYRHFVTVKGQRLAHTMHPEAGAPLTSSPASVTVLGRSCMLADAMATALMVRGVDRGLEIARDVGMSVLFIERSGRVSGTGLFDTA
ncbi:FAD:protein FMN transferase [Tabrizicola sp. M-4]|uniref:FAD:protein FMN transferase n=1 Tax=Tabrizicola sp. M-4 TaxID=3055847 RepID=UPI003DA93520